MSATCVSSTRMRAFLAGQLAVDDEELVSRHLEGCEHCEQLASELSDDGEARRLASVSRRTSAAAVAAPEIEDLRRRLHELGLILVDVDSTAIADVNDNAADCDEWDG